MAIGATGHSAVDIVGRVLDRRRELIGNRARVLFAPIHNPIVVGVVVAVAYPVAVSVSLHGIGSKRLFGKVAESVAVRILRRIQQSVAVGVGVRSVQVDRVCVLEGVAEAVAIGVRSGADGGRR